MGLISFTYLFVVKSHYVAAQSYLELLEYQPSFINTPECAGLASQHYEIGIYCFVSLTPIPTWSWSPNPGPCACYANTELNPKPRDGHFIPAPHFTDGKIEDWRVKHRTQEALWVVWLRTPH